MYAQDAVVSASWGTSAPVVGNGAAQGEDQDDGETLFCLHAFFP